MNETATGGSPNTPSIMAAMPSPSNVADTSKALSYEPKKAFKNCIVPFCPTKSEAEGQFRLFSFPKSLDIRTKWAENLQMCLEDVETYHRVCERHFEPRCVASQRLLENAVPTIELGYDCAPQHASGQLTGKGWRKCCIQNCKSNESEVYHRFPKDGPVRWSWLEACGLQQDNKDRYICGIHFEPEVGNKRRLPANTIPTKHLIIAENEYVNWNSCDWSSRSFEDDSLAWDTDPSDRINKYDAHTYDFDPSISEEERRFYLKAYATVESVRERKVHCTVCKTHIGTAPFLESSIKMHPILRVTHCMKCHDFYNSGEFSKGEDGSELYCRWCGQGGEVYCCSSCPYVFCKSCIVKNLSKGVVADIEQNENWNCFSCAPKILWPLRAQHWALMNYIELQKREITSMNLPEHEYKIRMAQDRSKCCRLAKSKCGNMSDSMESLDSVASKRSHGSSGSAKKSLKHPPSTPSPQHSSAKRAKANDEVVCTPDLLSMLEPDCQITVAQKNNNQRPMPSPSTSTPRVMSIPTPNFGNMSTPKSSAPPPLVLRNTAIKLRPAAPAPIVRRTVIGPRTPMPGGNGTPVYHTINGYRIDLNSAAQQETFRLPNGKLIQVKRQGPPPGSGPQHPSPSSNSWQIQTQSSQPPQQRVVPQTIASRPVQITPHPYPGPNMPQPGPQHPSAVRYHGNVIGSTTINAVGHNGAPLQVINGQISSPQTATIQQQQMPPQIVPGAPIRPVMVRHIFPDTAIGSARTQLQEQVFNAMEICTHLTNKVQTLTNSNAYKQAKNYLEVKELYIHLSYLLTYAIGRYKGLQDKCLTDMRKLGFGNDADCLENGQLAAAIDYVCYGQLEDVDLFNTGSNSFHNQVYEYRKSLHANLKDGEDGAKSPLPPLFALGQGKSSEIMDEDEDSLLEAPQGDFKGHWLEGGEDSNLGFGADNDENEEPDDNDDDDYSRGGGYGSFLQGTEESMKRNEESHSYDRKLTRLISQYPSIWCTRHPDYGNFEVTRKHWRTVESHFARGENIKLRWKNIRKRFVRIEKRIAEGKRFNGHFDKAMAFLANRDLPEEQWVEVDCGEDDGDTFDRQSLDAIEKSLYRQSEAEAKGGGEKDPYSFPQSAKPIEIEPLDLKIITFVKTNPVLWRKSMDLEADKIDEQTRQTVWRQLAKSLKTISADYIRDRWQHLYEMYKTFRLKTIKSSPDRSNLELKYSKYLAKLYFLYKIDEHELRNENNGLFEDCFELDDDDEDPPTERDTTEEQADSADSGAEDQTVKLQDMSDDKEFLHKLVLYVREYPALWNTKHSDYNDIMVRDNYWQDICQKLSQYKHKQASDDEDNEIEIVEPKTDLITLDSDDDEPSQETANKTHSPHKTQNHISTQEQQQQTVPAKTAYIPQNTPPSAQRPAAPVEEIRVDNTVPDYDALIPPAEENMDLMSMAQSFLASMLEVDINEGSYGSQYSPNGGETTPQKKQPRKKLTNKPNPTLLKQKAKMERERLEEMKRNDLKLKMKCSVELKRAEDEYPFARNILKANLLEKQKSFSEKKKEEEKSTTVMVDMGKEKIEVQLVIEDDNVNSSTEENGINKIKSTHEEESAQKKISDTERQQEEAEDNDSKLTDKSETVINKFLGSSSELQALEEEKKIDKEERNTPDILEDKETSSRFNKINEDTNGDKDGIEVNETTSEESRDVTKEDEDVDSDIINNARETTPQSKEKDAVEVNETEDKDIYDGKVLKNLTLKGIGQYRKESVDAKPTNEDFADDAVVEKNLADVSANVKETVGVNHVDDRDLPKNGTESTTGAAGEDVEDAEVYEEIEKVLQQRRQTNTDDSGKETETNLGQSIDKKAEVEPSQEEQQSAASVNDLSAGNIGGEDMKPAQDDDNSVKPISVENHEQRSPTDHIERALEKSISSPEVTAANAGV